MRFDSRSTDAVVQSDLVVNNAGISNVALLRPWHKGRPAAGRAAAMLAFAAGLLVAALGAGANEPARAQPTVARAGTDIVRFQPTAQQFAPPNQPEISASDASFIDQLYRQLIGPPPAASSNSRLRAAPNDAAAGSVRHWGPR